MNASSAALGAALALLGACLGLTSALTIEWYKRKVMLATRWDVPLFEQSQSFIATARQLVHLDRAVDRAEQLRALDAKHSELRGLFEGVRILGS